MDNQRTDRPERRTALIVRELSRYNVDVAALSETRLADQGQLTEIGGGYTFFWRGRSPDERREAGVAFAIRSHLLQKLTKLPEGHSDRLMSVQIPLSKGKKATLISAYAPTMTNTDDAKDKFYDELSALISTVPKADKLLVLGDFNARVGADHQTWNGIIGKQGIGKCNSNGLLLLRMCAAHDLTITNTMFRLPNRNKMSWMHPRSKHWHLIDYVLTYKKDRQDVKVTKSVCGAECWTDHRLIVSKLNLQIPPRRRPQGQKIVKRVNVSKLQDDTIAKDFSNDLEDKMLSLTNDQSSIEEQWTVFRDTVHKTALDHLGPTTRRNQDCFDENDEEIQLLLAEKRRLLRAHQDDPLSTSKRNAFVSVRSTVQKRLREMQDAWLSAKADEIQGYADRQDYKRFHDALSAVYGPQSSGTSPLLDASGNKLLTEKMQILERWAEHFNNVLNRPSSINNEAISRLPQVEINQELDDVLSVEEVDKAVMQMSSGKAPGSDAIPAEVYKAGGPIMLQRLTQLFQSA